MKFIDLTGKIFEGLTVKSLVSKGKHSRWLCLCECGLSKEIIGDSFISGNTKSCGCLKNKRGIILKNEMNQAIKIRQEQKLSFAKIAKILGVGKSSISNWCSPLEPKRKRASAWTKDEIEILKQHYSDKGSRYCAKIIGKSKECIIVKANQIGLRSNVTCNGKLKKIIIKQISEDRVISLCHKHGESLHSYKDNVIVACVLCQNINAKNQRLNNLDKIRKYNKEWMKRKRKNDPIYNLASKLRCRIRDGLRRCSRNNNIKVQGCFKNLNYTPTDLFNHLENIRIKQNNNCPICNQNYDKVGFNIEHVIPLKTARTEQEIINLFALSNLSLMCGSCNSSKNDQNYEDWMESKNVINI